MRAERAGQIAGLVLGLGLVAWLFLEGGDEPVSERPRAASESAAQQAEAREAERLRAERARSERHRAIAEGRAHGREPGDPVDAPRPTARGAATRAAGDEGDDAAKGPLGKSHVMPIHMNRLERHADRAVVEITGLDPESPRELLAWRIKDGRAAILARGESDENGRLVFPPVVAAGSGLEVVITGADGRPELPGASETQRLAPRPPQPPQGRVLEVVEGEAVLRVVPTEAGGAVLIADLDGTVFARYPLSPRPPVGTRAFDVSIELYGDDSELLIAHELADGRRSEWRALSVAEPSSLGVLLELDEE